jgi:hypothetical protein
MNQIPFVYFNLLCLFERKTQNHKKIKKEKIILKNIRNLFIIIIDDNNNNALKDNKMIGKINKKFIETSSYSE